MVHGVADLSSVRVGAIAGTSTEETLVRLRIAHSSYETLQDSIKALRGGKIDALVHDKPLLAWIIRDKFSSSVELLDATFDPQNYAFAVPEGSPLRKQINVAILGATHDDWWDLDQPAMIYDKPTKVLMRDFASQSLKPDQAFEKQEARRRFKNCGRGGSTMEAFAPASRSKNSETQAPISIGSRLQVTLRQRSYCAHRGLVQ